MQYKICLDNSRNELGSYVSRYRYSTDTDAGIRSAFEYNTTKMDGKYMVGFLILQTTDILVQVMSSYKIR